MDTYRHLASLHDLALAFGSVPTVCGVYVDRVDLGTSATAHVAEVTCPACLAALEPDDAPSE